MKSVLFTYLMTYGGAVVSLFNPFIGLLIYICFALIKPDQLWPWSVPEGNYSRIVAMALLVGWAARGFGDWRFGRAKGIVIALVGFLAWSALTAMQAEDRSLALEDVEALAKIVLPFLVGITLIDSERKLRQIAWVILLSVGYLAFEFNQSYLQGYNRIREEGFGGLDNNGVAILLNSCVGLGVFLALDARARWWQRALALGAALILMHAVLISNSRGGMLALLITTFTIFLLVPKSASHYAGFGLILVLIMWMAGDSVRGRFMTLFVSEEERDVSLNSRSVLLSYGIDSVKKRPILGVGLQHWSKVARREYGIPDNSATEVHNTWVQIAAESGLPGVILLLSFYGLCIRRLLPMARGSITALGAEGGDLTRGVISSLNGFIISSTFVTAYRIETPYYVVLIGAGMLSLYSPLSNAADSISSG